MQAGYFQKQMSTLRNTLRLPRLPFHPASPSLPPSSAGGTRHHTDLPFPCLCTISLFFSFFPIPLPGTPRRPLWNPPYILYTGERAFCSAKAFATCGCFQLTGKETNAKETKTSWVLGKGLHACVPHGYLLSAFWSMAQRMLETGWPSQQQKGLSVPFGQEMDGPQSCH